MFPVSTKWHNEIFLNCRMNEALEREKAQALIEHTKNKSDDDYEKNLTYISAGTLVLSLTFLEKVVKLNESQGLWFLIISWALMAITLGVNLVSHQFASIFAEKAIEMIPDATTNPKHFVKKAQERNKILRKLNWSTTGTLVAGMACLIIFCSINALAPPKKIMAENRKINTDSFEIRGRTVVISANVLNAAKEVQSNQSNTDTSSTNQSSDSGQQKKD